MNNKNITITFPDKNTKTYPKGITGLDIASKISSSLSKDILAIEFNGKLIDAFRPIEEDGNLKILTWNDDGGKYAFWHSSAHLLAEAMESLYPNIKVAIGPPIENGFYYDVDLNDDAENFSIEKVEKKMIELAKLNNEFIREKVSKQDALEFYKSKNNNYKVDLIKDLEDGNITFYTQGKFRDLCKGGHIPHTGYIKAIKLLNLAGAYWKGNEKNKQLTRVYGITFPKKKMLDEYLNFLEEAKLRDHRIIGKNLKLFTFSQKVGVGLPLWLPRGTVIREKLVEFLKISQDKAGYEQVLTPHIGSKDLYTTSGHYEKYGEDSFQPIHTPNENEEFLLKPMNCPHHCEIYATSPKSYKDLPIRLAEFGTVYRYEKHGEIHGIARTRAFTQDDAHIFCMPNQVQDEISKVIELVLHIFKNLGFENFKAQLSLRDPKNLKKYIGDKLLWDQAEKDLKEAAIIKGLDFYEEEGEAAFYGPKIDFMVKDSLNRNWQLGTVQLDYQLPQRFNLEYVGEDNQKHRPIMIHRAPFGSLERFIAILLEHTKGKLPFWLAPEQIAILPISEKYNLYSESINVFLKNNKFRTVLDLRNEKIGKKIREAELLKIPYMIVIGQREVNEKILSLRKQGEGDIGKFTKTELIEKLKTLEIVNP